MILEFPCKCGHILSRHASLDYDSRAIMNEAGWAIVKGGGYGCADCINSGQLERDSIAMHDEPRHGKKRIGEIR